MDAIDLFQRLGLALAIGLLIGLERGWRERDQGEGKRASGIRTFTLIGLLGGIWGALTPILGPVPLAAAALAFAAAFTLFEWRESVAREEFSVTSVIAGMVVFALGVFAVLGNRSAAAASGVATLALLAARTNLHAFLKQLTWPELRSAVVLLAMTFLLLPVLPDRTIDPWGAINPHELWLMIVLIATVSFAGYVAVRVLGKQRGLLVSSAVGAIVSSTTVTLNNARLAAASGGDDPSLSVAILIAWMVSLARMTAIASSINPMLLTSLVGPIASALAVLGLAAIVLHRFVVGKASSSGAIFQNPLDLQFVLGFGALLAATTVAANILESIFGSAGVLVLAGISGFVDVDPITLSTAQSAGGTLSLQDGAEAILLAAAANMVTKMGVAIFVGGPKFGWKLVLAGLLAIVAGGLIFSMGVR